MSAIEMTSDREEEVSLVHRRGAWEEEGASPNCCSRARLEGVSAKTLRLPADASAMCRLHGCRYKRFNRCVHCNMGTLGMRSSHDFFEFSKKSCIALRSPPHQSPFILDAPTEVRLWKAIGMPLQRVKPVIFPLRGEKRVI